MMKKTTVKERKNREELNPSCTIILPCFFINLSY